jgi:hypothetical protein
MVAERTSVDNEVPGWFDPFEFASKDCVEPASSRKQRTALSLATAALPLTTLAGAADAASNELVSKGSLNPANFNPICPASDAVYRGLQGTTQAIVGDEAFVEYGPLIAGGLLRIRLELCVVESFFNEAVGPFIEKNGYGWILPIHETVESFLAGTVFSLATTFILVGSTKIISVLFTYVDVFIGIPCRLFGGFFFDRARGRPVTLDLGFGPFKKRVVGPPADEIDVNRPFIENLGPFSFLVAIGAGAVKLIGEIALLLKDISEGIDLFVGRYLILLATFYIGIKFLHFRVFPDFPM